MPYSRNSTGYKGTATPRKRRKPPAPNPFAHILSPAQLRHREIKGTFVPELPAAAARAVAPRTFGRSPTISRYGVTSGGLLGLTPSQQIASNPLLTAEGVVANEQQPPRSVQEALKRLGILQPVETARVRNINENLKEPADLTNAILLASGAGGLADLAAGIVGKTAAKDVASEAAALAGEQGAKAAGEQATKQGLADALKSALKQGAAKAEPNAVRAARTAAGEAIPQSVKTAAKVAGRVGSYPIRHPITAPVYAQVPTAFIHGGNPKYLAAGFTGTGNYANALGAIGNVISPIPLAKEALTLPSTVLPSLYLGGKAAVNASQGHPEEIDHLLKEWEKTGTIGGLISGGPSQALANFEAHPLYGALEASGALNAAGRVAGAGLRAIPGVHIADTSPRPTQEIPGTRVNVDRGNYSRDALRNFLQKGFDNSKFSEIKPGTHRATHYEKEAANRFSGDARRTEQTHARERLIELKQALPKKGLFGKRLDRHSAEVVHLAVERLIQDPTSFHNDLSSYKELIDRAAKQTDSQGKPLLNKAELKRNRELSKEIERGAKRAHPGHVVESADHFIALQDGILQELVDLKLITPERAEMASAIPFARVHLGAGFGTPKKLLFDLNNQRKAIRKDFRGEARAALGGHVDAVKTAQDRQTLAQSGYVQAERSLATARAKLKADLANRKTAKGKQRVQDKLAQKLDAVKAAKDRVTIAKQEVRDTKAVRDQEARQLRKVGKQKTSQIEAQIKQTKARGEILLDKHGYPLERGDVHRAMAERGIEKPGFLSHRPPAAGDFYQPHWGGASLEKGARSGASVLEGKHVGGVEALVRQLRRSQGLVDRAHAWNDAINQFGIEIPGIKTMGDAKRVLEDPGHAGLPNGVKLVAVPRHPFGATKAEMQGSLDAQKPAPVEALLGENDAVTAGEAVGQHVVDAMDEVAKGNAPDNTPIVFFSEKVGKELRADAEGSGETLRAVQAATNIFKKAVLPFSVSFYIGNVFDNYLRTVMAGVTPLDVVAGVKAKKTLSNERNAQVAPGAHFSSVDQIAPHRSVQNVVTGGNKLADTIRAAAEWSQKHGVAQAAVLFVPKAIRAYTHYALATNALLSETLPSLGLLGKQVRQDIRATQGSWLDSVKLSQHVLDNWAKGIEDPAARVKFQKSLEQTLGNYSQMSPQARRVLSNVVPFWTWMRAAYKYVYVTVPAHRSVQTGLLTSLAAADQVEREQLGLEKYGKEPLPAWLQGSIPTGKGGVVPTANYNSFGFASDPLEAAGRASFAQFSNILEALKGNEFSGGKIEGEGGKLIAAGWGLLGSLLPGANDLFKQKGGAVKFEPHLAIPHEYEKSYLDYLREPKQTITVPKTEGGSSTASSGQSFAENWATKSSGSSSAQKFAENWATGGSSGASAQKFAESWATR